MAAFEPLPPTSVWGADQTRQNLINALQEQANDYRAMSPDYVAKHYSIMVPPQFRHIPIGLAHLPSGWIVGLQGVQAYFDMTRLYWSRANYIRTDSIDVDPVNMTVSFVVEVHWAWRNLARGPPWVEVVQGKMCYDLDFRVMREEYLTISGDHTNVLTRAKSSMENSFQQVSPGQTSVRYKTPKDMMDAMFFS